MTQSSSTSSESSVGTLPLGIKGLSNSKTGRPPTTQMRILSLLKEKPLLSNKQLAWKLHIKAAAISEAKRRLHLSSSNKASRNTKLCLSCNQELSLIETPDDELLCRKCGAVQPREEPKHIDPYGRGPVDALHWGNNLGSASPAKELYLVGLTSKFKSGIANKAAIIESALLEMVEPDPFLRNSLEELMDVVAPLGLDYRTTHDLGKELRHNVAEWREENPFVKVGIEVRSQLVAKTLLKAAIDIPRLTLLAKHYLSIVKLRRRTSPSNAKILDEFMHFIPLSVGDDDNKIKVSLSVINGAVERLKDNIKYFREKYPYMAEDRMQRRVLDKTFNDLENRHPLITLACRNYQTRQISPQHPSSSRDTCSSIKL